MTTDPSKGGNNNLKRPARDKWLRRQLERGSGKGDFARPVDKTKFDEGYERIFGKRPLRHGNVTREELER
jgi:hypothetical protein